VVRIEQLRGDALDLVEDRLLAVWVGVWRGGQWLRAARVAGREG